MEVMGLQRAALRLLCGDLRSEAIRRFSSSSGTLASLDATSTPSNDATPGSRDFMGWSQENTKRIVTPMSQPLPGVEPERHAARPLAAPPTEITVLSNGVRIISEASPVSLRSSRHGLRHQSANFGHPYRAPQLAWVYTLIPVAFTRRPKTLVSHLPMRVCLQWLPGLLAKKTSEYWASKHENHMLVSGLNSFL